jgi:hypothetical protein
MAVSRYSRGASSDGAEPASGDNAANTRGGLSATIKALAALLTAVASLLTVLAAIGWLPQHMGPTTNDPSPAPVVTPGADIPNTNLPAAQPVVPTLTPAASTANVAGKWGGSLFQVRTDFSTETVAYAMNFNQSHAGVDGVSLLTIPLSHLLGGSWVSHQLRGTLASGQLLHVDDMGILTTNNPTAAWCSKAIDLSPSPDGEGLSGTWRSETFGCGSGTINLSRLH